MVNLVDHHGDFLADVNVLVGQVAQFLVANQAVLAAGGQFHEHPEVRGAGNLAGDDVAHFGVAGQAVHAALGQIDHSLVAGGDGDGTVVGHINVAARFLLDGADDPPAGADEGADFLHGYLHSHQLGRVAAHLAAGFADGFRHTAEDVQPADAGLFQRFAQQFLGQAVNLDIHLQGIDALFGAGHLEVHIPQEILDPLYVAEDGVLPVGFVGDQAHGDAGHGRRQGDAGVHQGQGGAAHAAH